jgi:hypothetical protein
VDDSTRAALSAGAHVAYDGQRWEIAELSPPSVLLSGPAGELRRVTISHLAAVGSAVITRPGSGGDSPDTGAALSGLDSGELARLRERVAHVREACTGYRSGSPELAQPGGPRPEYGPGTGKLQRYQAKAAELRLGVRTIRCPDRPAHGPCCRRSARARRRSAVPRRAARSPADPRHPTGGSRRRGPASTCCWTPRCWTCSRWTR